MIEILTLLVGLMVGPSDVELKVEGSVARVEVRVDDQLHTELSGPPWRFRVDWGDTLRPRELLVVAFDDAGRELDRDLRFINMTSTESSARLDFPAVGEDGRIPHFSIFWAALGVQAPRAVTATFDDQPLEVKSLGQIPLPDYDPRNLHWLSVEVDFGERGKELLGASLGGETLVELSTELTAAVISLKSRRSTSKLEDAFLADGKEAPVHGIEKGPMHVVIVSDRGTVDELLALSTTIQGTSQGFGNPVMVGGEQRDIRDRRSGRLSAPGRDPTRAERPSQAVAEFAKLGEGTNLYFLWPRSASWKGPLLAPGLFATTPARPLHQDGLLAATHRQRPPAATTQMAPAVALAGLSASGSSRRRAVVLLGENLSAEDPKTVADTVSYLEALRVPLYVWTYGEQPDAGHWPSAVHLGAPSERVKARNRLRDAFGRLARDLGRQRVVWIEGRYLPQKITLVPGTEGVSWPVGAGPD